MLFPINVMLWLMTIAASTFVWNTFPWWGIVVAASLAAALCPYLYREATQLDWGLDDA